MAEREGKRAFICISSSSEQEEEDDEDDDDQVDDEGTEEEEEEEDGGDDGDGDDDDYDDGGGDDQNEEGDDEALCNKVIRLLKGEGSDLDSLSLKECKAYLRRHGLRISGTKAVCIQRIEEHRRLKDENGEKLYPRSSFVINCTGDVCKGDVVLFTQKVYEKYSLIDSIA